MAASRPHRRRLHRQAARPLPQVKLQVDEFRRAEGERLGPHPNHAVAQAPLQRTNRLPFQPIERISGRVRLRDDAAAEALALIVIVVGGAGQVELADPALEEGKADCSAFLLMLRTLSFRGSHL